MGTVNNKDLPSKINFLGQYFTPEETADFCLSKTRIETPLVIEPSCGTGVFLNLIFADKVIGLEVDESVYCPGVIYKNFYDFNEVIDTDVTFLGNPPFRTPAISITDDPNYGRRDVVHDLIHKYDIRGIREEAVFFIVKSVDLILVNKVRGHIYYILPKNIFHNNSRAYQTFFNFLRKYVCLEEVTDLPSDFDNVDTDLCYVHMSVGYREPDDKDYYGVNADIITFHNIFKKTYLGSVPCESVLLSVRNESREHFRKRLVGLFDAKVTENNLVKHLSYEGKPHLRALQRNDADKVKVVLDYVKEIRELVDDFSKRENYKSIQHRNEVRWYFRHEALKKASFVYQLNPNPCPSFYFPGNPVKGCLDYWGYCTFDVNRNCSPSANRTVPLEGLEDNLTDEFKSYWDENTGLPYEKVFDYLIFILGSDWYKEMKTKYQRWYFGIPTYFDKRFLQ